MADQQIVFDELQKKGQDRFQGGGGLQLLGSNPVNQGGAGMITIAGLNIVMKGLTQLDPQIPDPDRTDGYDLVPPSVEAGQLGIENDKER